MKPETWAGIVFVVSFYLFFTFIGNIVPEFKRDLERLREHRQRRRAARRGK